MISAFKRVFLKRTETLVDKQRPPKSQVQLLSDWAWPINNITAAKIQTGSITTAKITAVSLR